MMSLSGEGNTPLIPSSRIGRMLGVRNLWFKLESCNPSGSYKDRFACAAVSGMRAAGKTRVIATSSGNTGAALAAYCAAAGIECRIAIVETAPDGKLRQMMAYGAHIFRVRGFGPLLVAMDSHGASLYAEVKNAAQARRAEVLRKLGVV